MDFRTADYVKDDGSFTDSFTANLPQLLGDEFKDADLSTLFERTGNFQTLVKNFANTKRAYNTKLENVIQKPGADATDEQRAAYRAALLAELGAPKTAEEYGFTPPQLPEGLQYDEATDKFYSGLFAQLGVPKDIAAALRQGFIEQAVKGHEAQVKAETEAFENEVKSFNDKYAGQKGIDYARMAHKALLHFAGDDVTDDKGQVVKGLKTHIKEANLHESPTDFQKWKGIGITPSQLELWGNIGTKMQSGFSVRDEGGGGAGGQKSQAEQIKETGRRVYTHPTSQEMVNKA